LQFALQQQQQLLLSLVKLQ